MWMHNPRALHMRSVLDDPRAVGRLRSVTSSFAFPGECSLLAVLCGVYVCDVIPRLVHQCVKDESSFVGLVVVLL